MLVLIEYFSIVLQDPWAPEVLIFIRLSTIFTNPNVENTYFKTNSKFYKSAVKHFSEFANALWKSIKILTKATNSSVKGSGRERNKTSEFPCLFGWYFSRLPICVCPLLAKYNIHETDSSNQMKHEWSRYASFKNFSENLPESLTFKKIAESGFFYSGIGDEVQCFCCHTTWKKGDSIRLIEEHPLKCPLTDNIPIHNSNRSNQATIYFPPTLDEVSESKPNIENEIASPKDRETVSAPISSTKTGGDILNIDTYKALTARQCSFNSWKYSHVQDPMQLAQAGFVYMGNTYNHQLSVFIYISHTNGNDNH